MRHDPSRWASGLVRLDGVPVYLGYARISHDRENALDGLGTQDVVRVDEQHHLAPALREALVEGRSLAAIGLEDREHALTISIDDLADPSVDPSSTTITSTPGDVCARALSIASPRYCS